MSFPYLHFLEEKIQWRRPIAQILHNIQFASGGILVSKISKKYKTLWIIQYVAAPLTVISLNISYLVVHWKRQNFLSIAYVAQSTSTMIFCLVGELWSTFYSNSITWVIKTIDGKFSENQEDRYDDENEIVKFNRWIKLLSSSYSRFGIESFPVVTGFLICGVTFLYDNNRMHDVTAYFYAFPNLNLVDDIFTYITIMVWQILFFAPSIAITSLIGLKILIVSLEIRKEFAVLKEDIELHSEEFQRRMSAIYESESKLKKNPRNQITLRRRTCCHEFFDGLEEFIRRHRELIRTIDLFKPYINGAFTHWLLSVAVLGILFGFLLVVMGNPGVSLLEIAIVFLSLFSYTLLSCFIGNLFKDMNESIESAVYSMPWYELTPKQRKIIHLFLCQVQQTIKLSAFKIYPVNLEQMPQIINFVYSQIVGLKTIHDRK